MRAKHYFFLLFLVSIFFLIPSISAQTYENFTAYTEVDIPANRINVVNDTRADVTALDIDETVYLYRDYGTNYFINFTFENDVFMQNGVLNPRSIAGGVGNNTGTWNADNDAVGVRVRHTNTNVWQIGLAIMEGGVQTVFTYSYLNDSQTWVYARVTKAGTNVTAWFFTDRARTNLITRHTHILANNDRYRYAYGVRSDNIALGGRVLTYDSLFLIFDVNNITVSQPSNFFGAGFNDSAPFVELHWSHDMVNVDQFEINHSTDGITYNFLAYTSNLNYTHTGLVNGSNHWYRIRATYSNGVGTWFNSSWNSNFERVWFIGGVVLGVQAEIIHTYFQVNALDNKTGVLTGNQTEIQFPYDGLIMNLTEIVGAPAFDMRFNWTGLPDNLTCINILMRAFYTGNQAHVVQINIWNFTGGTWYLLDLIPDGTGFTWFNNSISGLRGVFLNNGTIYVQVVHTSAGNVNHLMEFDYVQLRGIIPRQAGGVVPLLGAWDINWLTSIIWLAVLGYGIFMEIGVIKIFAGIFGIILGLLMLAVNSMVAIALICINIYFVYEGTGD